MQIQGLKRANQSLIKLPFGRADFLLKLHVKLIIGLLCNRLLHDAFRNGTGLNKLPVGELTYHVSQNRQRIPIRRKTPQGIARCDRGWSAIDV